MFTDLIMGYIKGYIIKKMGYRLQLGRYNSYENYFGTYPGSRRLFG